MHLILSSIWEAETVRSLEFEAILIYRVSSQDSQGYREEPCIEKLKPNQKMLKFKG